MLSNNKRYSIFIIIYLVTLFACAEDDNDLFELTHNGDVFLNTQLAMERFAASGYTKVVGNVRIGTGITGEVSDVSSILLSDLKYVEGTLNISQTSLRNLSGLNALDSVSSDIIISGNPELINLDGFQSLKRFDAISITDNNKLENLDVLPDLDSISAIRISNNPMLNSISGLSGLRRVDANLIISDNPVLTELVGLSNLISVNGQMDIVRNGIESLSGLLNLEEIESGSIIENENLTTLLGLDKLERIGTRLQIIGNENLMSLDGLQALEDIGSELVIRDNSALIDFCAISSLISLQGLSQIILDGNNYNPNSSDFGKGDCEQ